MNVYKYELETTGEQIIRLPFASEILTVQTQGDKCCLWALVDPMNECEERTICIYGTGHPIKNEIKLKYISTFQFQHLGLVFHAFEKKNY